MMTKNNDVAKEVLEKKELWSSVRRAAPIQQIRRAMRKHNLLNKDMADRIGVSEARISNLLKGNQNIQLDTLFMLADALNEQLLITLGVPEVSAAAFDEAVAANGGEEFRCAFDNVYPMGSYKRTRPAPELEEVEARFGGCAA